MKLWEGSREEESQGERFEYMRLDPDIVTLSDLLNVFNNWVANTATDIDLIHWSHYFRTINADKMREIARGAIKKM